MSYGNRTAETRAAKKKSVCGGQTLSPGKYSRLAAIVNENELGGPQAASDACAIEKGPLPKAAPTAAEHRLKSMPPNGGLVARGAAEEGVCAPSC